MIIIILVIICLTGWGFFLSAAGETIEVRRILWKVCTGLAAIILSSIGLATIVYIPKGEEVVKAKVEVTSENVGLLEALGKVSIDGETYSIEKVEFELGEDTYIEIIGYESTKVQDVLFFANNINSTLHEHAVMRTH